MTDIKPILHRKCPQNNTPYVQPILQRSMKCPQDKWTYFEQILQRRQNKRPHI